MVAHFESNCIDFENIKTLWNAREQLSFSTADATVQRNFSSVSDDDASGGRFIKTWLDDGDGVVESWGIC